MCLVSLSLYIAHYLCVPLFPNYTTITMTITACSIFFSHKYSLFCSQWRSSNHDCFVHTQLLTRLIKFSIDHRLLCLALLQYKQNIRVVPFSRTLLRLHFCLCLINILVMFAYFVLFVIGLLITSSMYIYVSVSGPTVSYSNGLVSVRFCKFVEQWHHDCWPLNVQFSPVCQHGTFFTFHLLGS